MSLTITLFILRILSAIILLAFLGLIIWLMLKDIQMLTRKSTGATGTSATLIAIINQSGASADVSIYPLFPVTTLGRSKANDIVVEDDYSSNEHARISWQDDQWWLEDLGSSNGTYINDLPITKATVITNGDLITVGETKFRAQL